MVRRTTTTLLGVSFGSYRRCRRDILIGRRGYMNWDVWWRTTESNVSFETWLRGCGDILMGRRYYVLLKRRHVIPIRYCGDVPLRRFGNVPPRCFWVFHLRLTWGVARMYRETLLRHHHDVFLPGGTAKN